MKSSTGAKNGGGASVNVLVVTYPAQGHINPMLQFSKRLVSKGLNVTLAITNFMAKSMPIPQTSSIQIKTISDGYDEGDYRAAESTEAYLDRFRVVGSETLCDLIIKQKDGFVCIIYDAFLPWCLDVAKRFSVVGASFFTQSCAVNNIYYHVHQGLLSLPVASGSLVSLPGLPPLEKSDFPSFISVTGSYPSIFSDLVLNQFSNIDRADWILVNTLDKMEPEVVEWMSKLWRVRTIGPTLPSAYLDNRVEGDRDYGLSIFVPRRDTCMNWLSKKEARSVVYVSFGSLAVLTEPQMEELAFALHGCKYEFLWVIRATKMSKLPSDFIKETSDKGLVVNWCPQLEVLSHSALGCFVTHCGWNSTLEALSLGVPMVALPQWSDQPTNAKYVKDVCKMGLRARVDESGLSSRTEIEACIREIMEGEQGKEIKRSAETWKNCAAAAVDEGGSSDVNIEELISCLHPNTVDALFGEKQRVGSP